MGLGGRRVAVAVLGLLAVWSLGITTSGAQTTPGITSPLPPAGAVGVGYLHQFTASAPDLVYSVTAGALPPGLALAPSGFLTGTPTMAGSFGPTTVCGSNATTAPLCQTFTIVVARRSPSILVSASAGGPVGTPIRSTASLVGAVVPTGTMTFRLFSDANCTNQVFTSQNVVDVGGSATSSDFVTTAPGTFRWTASYSGDANNNPVTSACGAANDVTITGTGSSTTTTAPTSSTSSTSTSSTTSTTLPTSTTQPSTTVPSSTSSTSTSSTSRSSTSSSSTSSTSSTSTTSSSVPTGTTSSSSSSSSSSSTSSTSTSSSSSSTSTTVAATSSTTAAPASSSTTAATSTSTTTTVPTTTSTSTSTTTSTTTTTALTSTTAVTATTTPTATSLALAVPTVSASPQQVTAGQPLSLTGSGFPPGSALTAQLFSDPVFLGAAVADAGGSFRLIVTIPLGTAAGVHTVRVSATGSTAVAETTIVVVAPVAVAQVGGAILSRTGTDVLGPARLALALLVGGFVLVGWAWKGNGTVLAAVNRRRRWPDRRRW